MDSKSRFIKAIQKELGKEVPVYLYFKGRIGFYALLKALEIKEGDEVILPGFTCVVMANAIKYVGATPIYVDIDESTLEPLVQEISNKMSSNTKLIIAQNTFGLASDLDEILKIAHNKGIPVLDDCTHGFGGSYNQEKNGLVGDFTMFSSQWNKPFSTGIGGILTLNSESKFAIAIQEKLENENKKLLNPSKKDVLNLRLLHFIYPIMSNTFLYYGALSLFRFLSRTGLVVGSSSGEEISGIDIPRDYFKGMSQFQASKGVKKVERIASANQKRKEVAELYKVVFDSLGLWRMAEVDQREHIWLKFPILVTEREEFMLAAERARIKIGEWFVSPLHPIEGDLELWNYKWGNCESAEKIAQHIVNLPTDPSMTAKQIKAVIGFIQSQKKNIIAHGEI